MDGEVVARARQATSSSAAGHGPDPEGGGILQNIGEQELMYGPVNVTIRPHLATVFCSHAVAGSHMYQPSRGLSRAHDDHPSPLDAESPSGVLLNEVPITVKGDSDG